MSCKNENTASQHPSEVAGDLHATLPLLIINTEAKRIAS